MKLPGSTENKITKDKNSENMPHLEIRDRIYVKGYGFLSFPKNIGKNVSNKYRQKLLDSAKKSTTDAIKTASKRAIQKTAEATGQIKIHISKKDNKLLIN